MSLSYLAPTHANRPQHTGHLSHRALGAALYPEGSGGTNWEQPRSSTAASLPGPPPEVRQHIRVPGTRTGRAAIWPGSFPVGFPLHRAQGRGQSHSHPQAQKVWLLRAGGTATQVPAAGAPSPIAMSPGARGAGSPGGPRPGSGRRGEERGPRAGAAQRFPGFPGHPPSRPPSVNTWLDAAPGRVSPQTHLGATAPHTPRSQSESGAASAGGAAATAPKPDPQILSALPSSWDRKIPRTTGPAPPPPPSQPVTSALPNGLDS